MEWISANWVWILVAIAFLGLHSSDMAAMEDMVATAEGTTEGHTGHFVDARRRAERLDVTTTSRGPEGSGMRTTGEATMRPVGSQRVLEWRAPC